MQKLNLDDIRKSIIDQLPVYVDEKEVSRITGRALSSLRNDRHNRRGIPYYKPNRSVVYALSDVISYMEASKIVTE